MSEFIERIERRISGDRLLPRGQAVLVAVSGGLDSMVLLHALATLSPRLRWRLIVAHFNHRLRGRDSEADERFVRDAARRLKLDFVAGAADVRRVAEQEGVSIEMAARRCRHEFLAHEAQENEARRIVLAHHADDQVELFFIRLLRGSGSLGLSGMKAVSPSPCASSIKLVRPLLDCARAEIKQFATEQGIAFRDDASNQSTEHLRNRVRRELLPLLRARFQPGLDEVVLREMQILSAENDFLDAETQRWIKDPGTPFARLPVAIQRRILQRQLEQLSVAPDFERVEWLRLNPDKAVSVAAIRRVLRTRDGKVKFAPMLPAVSSEEGFALSLELGKGQGTFGGLSWKWTRMNAKGSRLPKFVSGTEWFDADRVGDSVILRFWRSGDRFQPIGMAGSQKLQDLFVNLKVPRCERGSRLVATTREGKIWWVEGLRIGEEFKLCPETRRWLRWEWSRRHPICGVE